MKLTSQAGKKIGIFGLGLTGHSTYEALKGVAETVVCWDDSASNRQVFSSEYGNECLKDLSHNVWTTLDKIIISPGVPSSHEVFLLAKGYNILISSDIQLFLEQNPNSKIVAVTGTNGKSTTVALIGHILRENELDYHIGGNIGLPALRLPENAQGYVLELSSFQLDLLDRFNPDIAVLLNITPDHLDRHGTFEKYCQAKFKAFQGDGIKVIGIDNDKSKEFYTHLKIYGDEKVIPISSNLYRHGISCDQHQIVDRFFNRGSYGLRKLNNLPGAHNRENIAASFAVCRALGLMPKEIIEHLLTFKGLAHRMQYLGTKDGISYYNDSKATNATSALCSLSALDNIFWLAGGIFKEDTLLPIAPALKNIKKAYLFGQSKMIFAEYLKNKVEYELCTNMEEAFQKATSDALLIHSKANILLAPACASFDQFKNFEDRGNQFIKLYDKK
ncbi:MAG: UDP-N-acetylmuramoyl-L-alanine--D-glutamate ligase [Rickettsiaceae bacterium]